jgi:DNA-binding transcriptional regulator YhcF (GntR family)
MIVEVDPTNPMPPYEQIRTQIETMIATGVLAPGTHLPSIRQLAGDLGLAVNTVARSYRELEIGGFVATRVRSGTTVAERRPTIAPAETRRRLTEAARAYLAAARVLNVSPDQALAAVRDLI